MNWDRRLLAVVALLAGVLIFAAGFKYAKLHSVPPPVISSAGLAQPSEPQAPATIKVHVAGAVENPGVYELPATARVTDAVEKAGPKPEADLNVLNLAELLTDGQKVAVPETGESVTAAAAGGTVFGPPAAGSSGSSGKVNINTAGAAELETLPGIGPALAERIVTYRTEHGAFRSLEDIKNVSGIGEGRFAQIKERISI